MRVYMDTCMQYFFLNVEKEYVLLQMSICAYARMRLAYECMCIRECSLWEAHLS